MNRLALSIALAFALAGSAGAEQFYKWQDETGAWHYTTQPPKDKQSQPVMVNAGVGKSAVQTQGEGGADASATPPPSGQPPGKPGEPVVANAETVKQMKEQQRMRDENCARAKANVATLESYSAVTVQKNGADVKLNEDEHLAELRKARQQVEIFCK